MKRIIHEIGVRYDRDTPAELERAMGARLGTEAKHLRQWRVVRRSIDARQRLVKIRYSIELDFPADRAPSRIPGATSLQPTLELEVRAGERPLPTRPVVVGGGPAGLFATYLLAKHGYSPLLLERGGAVKERVLKHQRLLRNREPNPECNLLFGLGGAGTFSDGKLTTSVRHPWLAQVLDILIACGAPEDIRISAKPHIGTDILGGVIEKLVQRIEEWGGSVRPGTRVGGIVTRGGMMAGLEVGDERIDAHAVVLAVGHSARDTIAMLNQAGIRIAPKPFQIGVRVEHPQSWLDSARYGEAAGHPALGAADYKLATKIGASSVFSFCMCPGGETVPTVNEVGALALNGMSRRARNSPFAGSGVVVTLQPEDFGGVDLISCFGFQREVERRCFEAGGSDYTAPGQALVDFAAGTRRVNLLPAASYRLGTAPVDLLKLLPKSICLPLQGAMAHFDQRLPGYLHPEAVVLAPESRASSPVRIVRDPNTLESVSVPGLYPVGEGAGYAGGIMSSALDGLDAAAKIIARYQRAD